MKYNKENLLKMKNFLEDEIQNSKNRINNFANADTEFNKYNPIAIIVKKYRKEMKLLLKEVVEDLQCDFNYKKD